VQGWDVLDLGAGTGIASYAFAKAGARRVVALEPDPSAVVGRGAMAPLLTEAAFELADGVGERLPFDDASFDLVYARQVLHHIPDLGVALREVARVLKPGGRFLACREHVCDDEAQMKAFLAYHPIHRLAENEGAHSLPAYRQAMIGNGLRITGQWGPVDSLINAYPHAKDARELQRLPLHPLRRLGPLAPLAGALPGVPFLLRALLRYRADRSPGRAYSFLAEKAA
jgi:SAM-dependent methyltransferase